MNPATGYLSNCRHGGDQCSDRKQTVRIRTGSLVSKFFTFSIVLGLLIAVPARAANPSQEGEWGAVESWGNVSVHTVLLPTGNVMFWPYNDNPQLYNPASGSVTSLPGFTYNPFCNGHVLISDGRLFVAGGHIANNQGLPNASYYDPLGNTWTQLPNMNDGRWYPTLTALGNGDILVVSGDRSAGGVNTLPQVWQVDSESWRNLTSAELTLPLYPKMFLASNGKVFFAGNTSRYIDTAGAGNWETVGARIVSGRDNYGSAVMYDNDKIVFIGGADPPTATAEVIDLAAPSPSWRLVGSMAQPRRQHNATLLPDGTVLVTGGSSGSGFDNDAQPVRSAELWNPDTEQFTALAEFSASVYRGYHSTAILLPDARVISSGGDNNPTAEIFSPPYLFNGARPTITSAPSSVSYGQTFFVETPDGADIAQITWIRPSAVTHTHNMDQRINRLSFAQTSGGLNVTAPSNIHLCPPGHYMLFLLNGNGVPSVSTFVRIEDFSSPPPAPSNLAATAGLSKVDLAWDAAPNAAAYNVKRATSSGGPYSQIATDVFGASYSDTSVTPGVTYYYVVTAVNPLGESGPSNEASATPLAGGSGTGLNGDYYDNMDFTAFALSRIDPTVDFDWGTGSPDPSIAADTFSVRWTGQVEPLFSETYTFYTVSDDGVRLWVDGQLVIDNWTDHAPTEDSGAIALTGGQNYDIQMDYYENGGGAVSQLLWSSPSNPKEIIPQSQLYPPSQTPGAPVDLTATGRDGFAELTWNPPSAGGSVDSYNVKRSTTSGGSYSVIDSVVATTSYNDTTAVNGTTYFYVVSAVNSSGEGPDSAEASATPTAPPPPPQNVAAIGGDAEVVLSWDSLSGVHHYDIYRSTTSGGPYDFVGDTAQTMFTDTTVVNGTTYYYVVTAENSAGEGLPSAEVSATPEASALAAPTNLTAQAKGKDKIDLQWTQSTSSGLTENRVYRSSTAGGPYSFIAAISPAESYRDAGLASGATYYYVVTAVNATGESPNSNEASDTTK